VDIKNHNGLFEKFCSTPRQGVPFLSDSEGGGGIGVVTKGHGNNKIYPNVA